MATLQSEIKRAFLRSFARAAKKSAAKLSESLEAFQDTAVQSLQSGRLLVGTSGGGYSSSFAFPAIGQQFSQEQVLALSEELLTIYEAATITLSAQGNASPTDPQILTVMLADDRMQSVTSIYGDFTLLRAFSTGTR